MSMPPLLLHLNIASATRTPVRLWLPLFLLWPLVALLLAVPLVVLAVVDVLLFISGQRYHHYSVLLMRVVALLGDTKGMVMRFTDGETVVDMTVY